tara:strand:+ start:3736 stop:3921 length:186 start_codon:yes stop_codon:yes gene_type:complete
MPIFRNTSNEQKNQNSAFHQSVSSTPMAMSMMIESMVNMTQINRPSIDAFASEQNNNQYDN